MRGLFRGALLCAVVVLAASAQGASAPVTGWLTFGGGNERLDVTPGGIGSSTHAWFYPVASTITTQPLVANGVPGPGERTVYAASAGGFVYAFAPDGYVRWRVDLGHMNHPCPQIPDGWGVTGTPVIDAATRTLYVVDAFGRMHALDLATGAERAGWPVVVVENYRYELVWGASILVDGSVYVGTGSYCDASPMEGHVVRVNIRTREVSSWTSVPLSLGGGGGVWGWGGPSYSSARDSLFVLTGNAFEGGTNVGPNFDERAGYGEQLVELSRDLTVKAASAPHPRAYEDDDLTGAPVVVTRSGCPEQVVAASKSGILFGWNTDAVAAGPAWSLPLQAADPDAPLLTEIAYSPALSSIFVVTASQLVRIAVDASCKPAVVWSLTLGLPTLYGSPVIAGNRVWVAYATPDITGRPEVLIGVDVNSGKVVSRRPIGGISFAPPTAVDGMLFLGVMHGFSGRAFPVARGRPATRLAQYSSFSDRRHGWQSREDGIFATADGGRTWRRISGSQAVRVVRTSATAGVAALGAPSAACACTTRRIVTLDGGRTWTGTQGLSGSFQGRGNALWWWSGGSLFHVVKWPVQARRIASRLVAKTDGTIVDTVLVPNGLAALVDRGPKPPQVIVARGAAATVETLPAAGGQALVRRIGAAWPSLTVTGKDYSHPTAAPDPALAWRSRDGGKTWSSAGPG